MVWAAAFFWILISAPVVFFALTGVDQSIRAGYSIISQIISPVLAASLCYWAASAFLDSSIMRKVWRLLGSGVLLWGVGAILYSVYPLFNDGQETPYPWYSDYGYLLMYIPCLLAFIYFKQHLNRRIPNWGILMAVAVFCMAFILAIYFYIEKLVQSDSVATYIVTLLYMFGDPILLGSVVLIASTLTRTAEVRAWWLVSVGFLLFYIANVMYTYLVLVGSYMSGNVVDIGWVLGFGLVGVAALITKTAQKNDLVKKSYV